MNRHWPIALIWGVVAVVAILGLRPRTRVERVVVTDTLRLTDTVVLRTVHDTIFRGVQACGGSVTATVVAIIPPTFWNGAPQMQVVTQDGDTLVFWANHHRVGDQVCVGPSVYH